MSPRYIVLVGTSVAPSQHNPSQAWNAIERVREHRDHVLTRLDPEAPVRVGPPQVGLVQVAARLRVPVDVLHRDGVGIVAREPREQVRQHELTIQHVCVPRSPRGVTSESSFTGVYVSGVVDYPGLLADLAAEEADLDARRRRVDDAGWAHRRPPPWDGTCATRSPTWRRARTSRRLALADADAFGARLAVMLDDLEATEDAMLRRRSRPVRRRSARLVARRARPRARRAAMPGTPPTGSRGSPAGCRRCRSPPRG